MGGQSGGDRDARNVLPGEADTPHANAGLVQTGFFHARPGYRAMRRRGTDDWLLTYTLKGGGFYRQPGVEIQTSSGDLVLLEPGAYHHYGTPPGGEWKFLWAHFVPRSSWLSWLRWPLKGKGLRMLSLGRVGERTRLYRAFLRCHEDSWSAGVRGMVQDLAMNGLEEVLLLAVKERSATVAELSLSPGVQQTVEYLSEHLAERVAVPDLARLVSLSPSRFAHRFKEETGESVIAYLLKLRLKRAAQLLAFPGAGVKEVAAAVGFESPFYFTRQFRRHFGASPSVFRGRGQRTLKAR